MCTQFWVRGFLKSLKSNQVYGSKLDVDDAFEKSVGYYWNSNWAIGDEQLVE